MAKISGFGWQWVEVDVDERRHQRQAEVRRGQGAQQQAVLLEVLQRRARELHMRPGRAKQGLRRSRGRVFRKF